MLLSSIMMKRKENICPSWGLNLCDIDFNATYLAQQNLFLIAAIWAGHLNRNSLNTMSIHLYNIDQNCKGLYYNNTIALINVVYLAGRLNYTIMVACRVSIYGALKSEICSSIITYASYKISFLKSIENRKNNVQPHFLLSSSMASNGLTAQIFISIDCSSPEEHSGNFFLVNKENICQHIKSFSENR